MRSPKDFSAPLAVEAPEPRRTPASPSRTIHFVDPGNERTAAKVPGLARRVEGRFRDTTNQDTTNQEAHS